MELRENPETAVVIRGACKEYEKGQKVLDELNMTVNKGSIYGLLGASGCGKTTLLSAVVGCRKLQKGLITIFGYQPGMIPTKSIGYMPQDLSLLEEFSIKNCLQYQGYLYGMSNEKIKERHRFLEKLLELPPGDRLVRELSGGQQRRLSLAVSLVHDPELLILDEPTVGLDPLLRQNIWSYFLQITEEDHKTVIITTHYLEEAKQAHTIGLLRNGKILAEGEPQALLREYDCDKIEDVFALLSTQQEELEIGIDYPKKQEPDEPARNNEPSAQMRLPSNKNLNKSNFTNLGHAKGLLLKNVVRFMRNPEIFLLAILLPVIELAVFFPSIGVMPADLQIGIINEELENYTNCNEYISNDNFIGGEMTIENNETSCVYRGLSCLFIQNIGSIIPNQVYFKTEEEAFKSLKKGKFHYILHFPRNYSEAVTKSRNELMFFNDGESEESEEFHNIQIYRDVKDFTIGVLVEKELYYTYQRFAEKLATECGNSEKAARMPVRFQEPVYGEVDPPAFAKYTAPGIILILAVLSGSGLSLMNFSSEKQSGLWQRTLISGVTTTEILLYDVIFLAFVGLIQTFQIFLIAFGIFQAECNGSYFYVLLLLYINSVCTILESAMISAYCKTVSACLYIGVGVFISKVFACGVIWPMEGITWGLFKYLCYLAPQTLSIEALRWILYRGWGIFNLPVFLGFITPIIYTIIFAALSIIIFKFERK